MGEPGSWACLRLGEQADDVLVGGRHPGARHGTTSSTRGKARSTFSWSASRCAGADCAVVPFGGGTSVVGGVTALRGAHRAVIALSLRRLDRCVHVDPVSLIATLQAGMTGPQAEEALEDQGEVLWPVSGRKKR